MTTVKSISLSTPCRSLRRLWEKSAKLSAMNARRCMMRVRLLIRQLISRFSSSITSQLIWSLERKLSSLTRLPREDPIQAREPRLTWSMKGQGSHLYQKPRLNNTRVHDRFKTKSVPQGWQKTLALTLRSFHTESYRLWVSHSRKKTNAFSVCKSEACSI